MESSRWLPSSVLKFWVCTVICTHFSRSYKLLSPSQTGKEKNLWEEEVFKFARLHQLRAVTPYLPRGECRLDPHIYEMVLFEFLKTDSAVRTHMIL